MISVRSHMRKGKHIDGYSRRYPRRRYGYPKMGHQVIDVTKNRDDIQGLILKKHRDDSMSDMYIYRTPNESHEIIIHKLPDVEDWDVGIYEITKLSSEDIGDQYNDPFLGSLFSGGEDKKTIAKKSFSTKGEAFDYIEKQFIVSNSDINVGEELGKYEIEKYKKVTDRQKNKGKLGDIFEKQSPEKTEVMKDFSIKSLGGEVIDESSLEKSKFMMKSLLNNGFKIGNIKVYSKINISGYTEWSANIGNGLVIGDDEGGEINAVEIARLVEEATMKPYQFRKFNKNFILEDKWVIQQ